MDEQQKDPYKVLLRTNKIPLSLIRDNKDALPEDGIRKHRARITVETEPFAVCVASFLFEADASHVLDLAHTLQQVFGPKAQRKRVKLSVPDIGALAGDSSTHFDRFEERQEEMKLLSGQLGNEDDELGDTAPEPIFLKGTSYVLPACVLSTSKRCGSESIFSINSFTVELLSSRWVCATNTPRRYGARSHRACRCC